MTDYGSYWVLIPTRTFSSRLWTQEDGTGMSTSFKSFKNVLQFHLSMQFVVNKLQRAIPVAELLTIALLLKVTLQCQPLTETSAGKIPPALHCKNYKNFWGSVVYRVITFV